MPKVSAKNGIILLNGVNISTYGMDYGIRQDSGKVDVTGFSDGAQNYVPGLPAAEMSVSLLWDSTATTGIHALMSPMGNGIVTILPEGSTAPSALNPAGTLNMPYQQGNYMPGGAPAEAIRAGTLQFFSFGPTSVGIEGGWLLQHGTITATTTGAEWQDPSLGAVTAPCSGTLQVWTPTTTDTYVVKIQHATTSGGAYSDLITFTANGTTRLAERVNVASGVINRYRRILATRTGAAANPFGFTVHFWHA